MKNTISSLALLGVFVATSYATPTVQVRLPERFRLLNDQLFDLRVEATNLTGDPNTATVTVTSSDGTDLTAGSAPEVTINNTTAGQDKAYTYRARSFAAAGVKTDTVTDDSGPGTATQRIGVQKFSLRPNRHAAEKEHRSLTSATRWGPAIAMPAAS